MAVQQFEPPINWSDDPIPVANYRSHIPILDDGRRVGVIHVVPWFDAWNAAGFVVDAANYMLDGQSGCESYYVREHIHDYRGNQHQIIERVTLKPGTPRLVHQMDVEKRNMKGALKSAGLMLSPAMRSSIAQRTFKALGQVLYTADVHGFSRRQLAEIEAPWRWRDYVRTEPPDQDCVDALTAVLELDNYGFACQFVRGQAE